MLALRPRTQFRIAIAAFGATLALAPAALAQTYCVTPATGCPDGTFATVQDALNQAQTNAGADVVRLGATTYTSAVALTYDSTSNPLNAVTIGGAGRAATILTRSTAGNVMTLAGLARERVGDLGIHIAGTVTNSNGILGGTADFVRVDVDADPGVTNSEGLQTLGGGSVRDSRISMATSGGTIGIACSCSGLSDGVYDATVTADTGFSTFIGGTIQRTRVIAGHLGIGIVSGDLDNASVRLTGTGAGRTAIDASSSTFGGGSNTVNLRHVTALADTATGATGLRAGATTLIGSVTQAVDVRSSILRGFAVSATRTGTGSGGTTASANLAIHYSDYDASTVVQTGPGTALNTAEPTNLNADPQFADPAAGDLRVTGGSPAIDAADPAPPFLTDSATDLGGLARVVDGNGDGTPRSDMGAFEYQRRAPVITAATATPATALAGAPIGFSAQAADADGDAVALTWSFDDVTTASGPAPSHAFASAGSHVATVTATDSAGATATATVAVSVVAPPASPPLIVTPPAVRATVGSLAFSPKAFLAAKGTTASFKLNVAATATFTAERATTGRALKGRCVRATKANRKAKACTRYVAVKGSFTHKGTAGTNHVRFTGRVGGRALPAGAYRMTVAVGSGTAKSVSRAAFTVKQAPRHKP